MSDSSQDIRLAQSFLRPFLLRGGVGERELLRPRPRPPAAGRAVARAAAMAAFCGSPGGAGGLMEVGYLLAEQRNSCLAYQHIKVRASEAQRSSRLAWPPACAT